MTALAERLRRELTGYEEALGTAAATLEAARQEETDATLALLGREVESVRFLAQNGALDAARKRLRYATKGRELAWLSFTIARAQVNFHAGVLHRLERFQPGTSPTTT